jgi:hypothetical protein
MRLRDLGAIEFGARRTRVPGLRNGDFEAEPTRNDVMSCRRHRSAERPARWVRVMGVSRSAPGKLNSSGFGDFLGAAEALAFSRVGDDVETVEAVVGGTNGVEYGPLSVMSTSTGESAAPAAELQ